MAGLPTPQTLNDKQRHFVRLAAASGDLSGSALKAGYAEAEDGQRLTELPQVAAAIADELRRVLETKLAPRAFRVLELILKDRRSGARVRVDAAKILLDRAGYAPRPMAVDSLDGRQLSDLSQAELKAIVGKLEDELADRATPVSAPDSAPNEGATGDKGTVFLD